MMDRALTILVKVMNENYIGDKMPMYKELKHILEEQNKRNNEFIPNMGSGLIYITDSEGRMGLYHKGESIGNTITLTKIEDDENK